MIRCYARVSSKGQEKYGNGLESQIAELKAAGEEKVYSDAYTGTISSQVRRLIELVLKFTVKRMRWFSSVFLSNLVIL